MTHQAFSPARKTLVLSLLLCLGIFASAARAQTASIKYDLKDVWFSSGGQMTGTFVWTYPISDFDKGTGQFTSIYIPIWGSRTFPTYKVQIDVEAIEITLIGSYHNYGLDLMLKFARPLSLTKSSPIDLQKSKYDINGRKGTIVRGSIVPRYCPPPRQYGTGSAGTGGIVPDLSASGGEPRIGNAAFQLDATKLLGGATCFFVVGANKASLPMLGVTVLVDPRDWILVALRASGSTGTAGAGSLNVPMPIPANTSLIGAGANFQVVAIDAGAPKGLASATNGLFVQVCR